MFFLNLKKRKIRILEHWLAEQDTLESQRPQLTGRFFDHVQCVCEASCLHYLLLEKRDSSVTDCLRHTKTFELITARTNKFRNYFLSYWLRY